MTEAQQGRLLLEATVAETISRLSGHADPPNPRLTALNSNPSGTIMETETSSIMTTSSARSTLSRLALQSTLFSSRPYRGIPMNGSAISLASSNRRGTRWSSYSGGSNTSVFSLSISAFQSSSQTLADTTVSDIPLLIGADSLYNWWRYDTNSVGLYPRPVTLPRLISSMLSLEAREPGVALFEAVKFGDTRALLRMLGPGVRINAINANTGDQSLLICAVRNNHEGIARILLNLGADLELFDQHGQTALHHAILRGRTNIVQLLLDRGADPNASYKMTGDTPLHNAGQLGHSLLIFSIQYVMIGGVR